MAAFILAMSDPPAAFTQPLTDHVMAALTSLNRRGDLPTVTMPKFELECSIVASMRLNAGP
jgi:hypothetical protein